MVELRTLYGQTGRENNLHTLWQVCASFVKMEIAEKAREKEYLSAISLNCAKLR